MRTLGRYELLAPLARGGMAEVYLARRRVAGVEKRLVIKRLRRERISDPRFLDLFVKEAQLSMTLVQQNIVPVFDFGRIGDDVFLAMEHIDGKDLGSTLGRARGTGMPAVVAAFVAAECCHALHHAHSGAAGRNVVHRDVTPRNVLLSWSGEVKLADFGIASAMGLGDASLVGTPGYMAPEQARGEPLDARTDLYALGLVLWEMLTGEHVRGGADAAALLEAAKRGALPPVPTELPEALRSLLVRATAAARDARIDSARTMADELDSFIVGERARHGGAAPAQQLAAWLARRWEGARDESAELPRGEDGRVVTFLDDGAAGILGTGTIRSMAATGGPIAPAPGALAAAPDAAADAAGADVVAGAPSGADSVAPPGGDRERGAAWRSRWLAVAAALGALAAALVAVVAWPRGAGPAPAVDTAARVAQVVDAAPQGSDGARSSSGAALAPDAAVPVDAAAPVPDAARAIDAAVATSPPDARPRRDARQAADASAPPAEPAVVPFTIGAKPWAHVLIDGDPERHETPVTVRLPPGKHRLRFENPELGAARDVTIEVTVDGPRSYVLDLRP